MAAAAAHYAARNEDWQSPNWAMMKQPQARHPRGTKDEDAANAAADDDDDAWDYDDCNADDDDKCQHHVAALPSLDAPRRAICSRGLKRFWGKWAEVIQK